MRRALVALTAAAFLVSVPAAAGQTQTLFGSIQAGSILLRDAAGHPVTQLAPGTYDFQVTDSDAIHNFHLLGTPVDTPLEGTGTFTYHGVALTTASSYTYLCDAHPEIAGSFTVSGTPPPPPPPPPPGSTLHGSISNSVIGLTDGFGYPITKLDPGTYTFRVTDDDPIHNFHLLGTRVTTSVEGTGVSTRTVALVEAVYRYLCDVHPELDGRFTVGNPTGPPAAIAGVTVGRVRGVRVVSVSLKVKRRSAATARLLRGSKLVASTRATVRPGRHTLRLRLPASARRGRYTLRVVLTEPTSGRKYTLKRSVRVPR